VKFTAYFYAYQVVIDNTEGGRFQYNVSEDLQEIPFQFGKAFNMPQGRLIIEKRSIFDTYQSFKLRKREKVHLY